MFYEYALTRSCLYQDLFRWDWLASRALTVHYLSHYSSTLLPLCCIRGREMQQSASVLPSLAVMNTDDSGSLSALLWLRPAAVYSENRPRCCRRHKRSVITSELTPLQRTEGTSVPPGSLWSHGWNSVLLLENWARTEHPHVSAQRVHVHMCSCCESHVNTGTINVTSRKSLKTSRQDILWN